MCRVATQMSKVYAHLLIAFCIRRGSCMEANVQAINNLYFECSFHPDDLQMVPVNVISNEFKPLNYI